MQVRDKVGRFDDIITGYDTIEGYINNFNYDGAMIGRYANRIGGAKFTLDGTEYKESVKNKAVFEFLSFYLFES